MSAASDRELDMCAAPEGATVAWDGQRFVPIFDQYAKQIRLQQQRTQHWFNAAQFAFRRGFWCGAFFGAVSAFAAGWIAFNYGAGL